MKTSQQIIGLPVVSISDGNEIGKVKNVIINAVKGTVDFFVIDSGIRSLAGGVIPVAKVLGIGEYALTIMEPDDISDIVKIPTAIDLLQKNITVRGTRVLTKRGSLLGETGDLLLEEKEDCKIIGVEFVPSSDDVKSGIIPRSCIITFGKNLLVVDDNLLEELTESPFATETVEPKKTIPAAEPAPATPVNVEPNISEMVEPEIPEPAIVPEASVKIPAEQVIDAFDEVVAEEPLVIEELAAMEIPDVALVEAESQPELPVLVLEQAEEVVAQVEPIADETEELSLDRFIAPLETEEVFSYTAEPVVVLESEPEPAQEIPPVMEQEQVQDTLPVAESLHTLDIQPELEPEPILEMPTAEPEPVLEVPAAEPEPEVNEKPFVTPFARAPIAKTGSADLFSERQKQFLRGRRVTKNIKDANGQILANAGETITDEIIDEVKKAEKLVELVMNNEP